MVGGEAGEDEDAKLEDNAAGGNCIELSPVDMTLNVECEVGRIGSCISNNDNRRAFLL